ncbi:MAG: hypothetical protein K2X47_11720 [Bdellovibrionales bacterium]|nr:hypothetical protein [Bdellovibrionales bacterium]
MAQKKYDFISQDHVDDIRKTIERIGHNPKTFMNSLFRFKKNELQKIRVFREELKFTSEVIAFEYSEHCPVLTSLETADSMNMNFSFSLAPVQQPLSSEPEWGRVVRRKLEVLSRLYFEKHFEDLWVEAEKSPNRQGDVASLERQLGLVEMPGQRKLTAYLSSVASNYGNIKFKRECKRLTENKKFSAEYIAFLVLFFHWRKKIGKLSNEQIYDLMTGEKLFPRDFSASSRRRTTAQDSVMRSIRRWGFRKA